MPANTRVVARERTKDQYNVGWYVRSTARSRTGPSCCSTSRHLQGQQNRATAQQPNVSGVGFNHAAGRGGEHPAEIRHTAYTPDQPMGHIRLHYAKPPQPSHEGPWPHITEAASPDLPLRGDNRQSLVSEGEGCGCVDKDCRPPTHVDMAGRFRGCYHSRRRAADVVHICSSPQPQLAIRIMR